MGTFPFWPTKHREREMRKDYCYPEQDWGCARAPRELFGGGISRRCILFCVVRIWLCYAVSVTSVDLLAPQKNNMCVENKNRRTTPREKMEGRRNQHRKLNLPHGLQPSHGKLDWTHWSQACFDVVARQLDALPFLRVFPELGNGFSFAWHLLMCLESKSLRE